MALEWAVAADWFTNAGFAAVTAFLLWERYKYTREAQSKIDRCSDALIQHAKATQALVSVIERQGEAFKDLQHDVRDAVKGPFRGF